jgi:dipeptidyl aminopeptidase/acylaminoacyl peptidase
MTPRDLLGIRFVSDPALSPDGRRVAFVVTTLSEERDEYLSQIWMVSTDGREPHRFTTGPKRDTAPRWSPDGRFLAFISERGAKKKGQLYVIPADGGEPMRLTDLTHGVSRPIWSPDGTRLTFIARTGGWQEPEDPDERERSRPVREISSLKYKFNGEGFVHDRRPHLFVVPATGGELRQITDGDYVDGDPAWSPDGRLIAFTSARHPDRDYDNISDVWVVSPDGGEPRRVTDAAGPVASPAFSLDGATIAYLGHRHPNEAARTVRVFTVPVDGGPPTCLTAGLDRSCAPLLGGVGLAWSADGEWILFPIEDHGDVPLYRVRAMRQLLTMGAPATAAAPPERIVAGARQVTAISSASQRPLVAFTATDPVSPAELFVCEIDGGGERQLTDLNAAWKAATPRSRPERFDFERADYRVEAWIVWPIGFQAGRRYPALLSVHGGPHTQYGRGFSDEFQIYAGAGYAVIYTNPRGSQGYGEAFARAVVGDWGGGDYADVLAGLDEALRRYDFIDAERLGVLGGSYGGFMTSWIIGHTDRFRAACSERAVNNPHSMIGTSDIGHYFQEWESGCAPWDNPEWYLERSPLTYVKRITTPLLIIHGEDDLRCPIEQAEQLFVALKKLRKEVRFVRFPQEHHEMTRSGKPRHRLERFRIILEWFDRYLTPDAATSTDHPPGA